MGLHILDSCPHTFLVFPENMQGADIGECGAGKQPSAMAKQTGIGIQAKCTFHRVFQHPEPFGRVSGIDVIPELLPHQRQVEAAGLVPRVSHQADPVHPIGQVMDTPKRLLQLRESDL